MEKKKLTTAGGRPYVEFENSQTVGNRGPILIQDYFLQEDMAHFNRERIPERVVHAKGTGAFGTFKVTNDISRYTKAKVFNVLGEKVNVDVQQSFGKIVVSTTMLASGFYIVRVSDSGNYYTGKVLIEK